MFANIITETTMENTSTLDDYTEYLRVLFSDSDETSRDLIKAPKISFETAFSGGKFE